MAGLDGFLLWLVLGLLLMASEMFTGTFHLLFFGLAALVTSALSYFGLEPFWVQVLAFSLLAAGGFWWVQKQFGNRRSEGNVNNDVNHEFSLSSDMGPRGEAMVQYQGSLWTAVNTSEKAVSKGQRVKIVRTEGTKIYISTVV